LAGVRVKIRTKKMLPLIDLDSSTYDDFHDGGTELIGYFQVKDDFVILEFLMDKLTDTYNFED
jgi:hypothetical protein